MLYYIISHIYICILIYIYVCMSIIHVYDCTYMYNLLHVHIDTVLLWRSNFPAPIPTLNASGTEASTRSVVSSWLLCRLWPMILAGCHTGSVLDRWTVGPI